MTIPFTLSGGAITVFLAGVPHSVDDTHPNFSSVLDLLKSGTEDAEEITKLVSIQAFVADAVKGEAFGNVTVGQDAIYYCGHVMHTYLARRMLEIVRLGMDVKPWALFMDKLYANPSKTAVDELFLWLEKANMPITSGGNFLAYKKVKDDYTSFHRGPNGPVSNNIGSIVSMPRNEVDDVRDRTCSSGLHFCSWHYLPQYYGTEGKVVIVEIDPGDVVSIPSDYDNAKGRAWRYKVVGEIDQKDAEFAFRDKPVVDDSEYVHDDDDDDDYDYDY